MTVALVNVYSGTGVTPGAMDFLYELIAQRPQGANISHANMPTMEQHRQFVERRPYRYWYLIEVPASSAPGAEHVGAVYATDRNEIGIGILNAHQRRGYGSAAVRELMAKHEPLPAEPSVRRGAWLANINPGNAGSIAMFTALGARLISQTYEL